MLEELNYQEMSEVKGGVSPEEYCITLFQIIMENTLSPEAIDGAIHGYDTHCKDL